MFKKIKTKYYASGAAVTMGISMASESAHAAAGAGGAGGTGGGGGNSFSIIAENITTQIQNLPGLITALSYLFGLLLAVLGVLKLKDHVENPSQTPLKDAAIRLLCGGLLFALPILLESMTNLLNNDTESAGAVAASMNQVQFNVS